MLSNTVINTKPDILGKDYHENHQKITTAFASGIYAVVLVVQQAG
jgi:hypothetical protein